ncbi:hypothetical protein [Reyranella sp.]|uniref:hypothetical protein n=1 Tax=Reyranella sp. TaxID=1929291 RepID=UPI003D0DC174
MANREIILAVARSLYWGYIKDTTGTPGKWSELNEADRKVWLNAGWRAVRRLDELRSLRPTEAEQPSDNVE